MCEVNAQPDKSETNSRLMYTHTHAYINARKRRRRQTGEIKTQAE